MQKPAPLPPLDDRIEIKLGHLENHADLYTEGDAAIQPSKMEGTGFMVLEPLCTGLPVVTTDYPPMNEYIRQPEMLVRKRWFKRKAFPTRVAGIRHAHLRLPSLRDLVHKIEWCATHDLGEISRANRDWAEETFNPEAVLRRWTEALG
jgi:glycosyltransferase involved in cell wall biosynthesis